jgi:two-component system, LuxR family, response regulator FixJ
MRSRERIPTVYVVDDDEAVRNSLTLLLKSHGMATTAYASATEFLTAYDPQQPGCAIFDVRMPGMSGLDLQHELNRRGTIIPVIFITGHGDVPMAVEAMQNGAFDFLQKPFGDMDLCDRVRRAMTHDRANREQLENKDQLRSRVATLTPREREVLTLVTAGKPNKIMAAELGVSQRTVEIHRAHVMEKMGTSSLAQLVRMMVAMGD